MTRSSSDSRRQRGFTLLEVLVALAIIGLALTAISVTIGGTFDSAMTLRDRTYASWIAQNRIIEFRASGTIPEVGTTSGEVDYANREWAWRAVVSETGVENLRRIDVEVSVPTGDSIRKVTGFVGEPVFPGQANRVWIGGGSGAGPGGNPGSGPSGNPGSGSGGDDGQPGEGEVTN